MAERTTPRYEIAGVSAAGPAFARVRDTARTLVAEGRGEEAFEFLLAAPRAVLRKSRELELLLARMRRVGRSSERLDPKQLALVFEELMQLGSERAVRDTEAASRADARLEEEIRDAEAARRERGEPARRPGLSWRTRDIEHEVHQVEVPAEERGCERCGREKLGIGEDVSRVLEFVPGHFVEHEYHREKWACGTCKRGVTTAPAPEKVIGRSAADASLLAHVVVTRAAPQRSRSTGGRGDVALSSH